jgi:hypothetical protein
MAITARVVPDALVTAGLALLDMATERGRPTALDRGHDTTLRGRKRSIVL